MTYFFTINLRNQQCVEIAKRAKAAALRVSDTEAKLREVIAMAKRDKLIQQQKMQQAVAVLRNIG